MTADRDDLAAILAKHEVRRYSYNAGRNAECVCSCDETVCRNSEQDSPHGDRHRAHVAQMVLESDWLRRIRNENKPALDLMRSLSINPTIPDGLQVLMREALDNTTDRT